MICVLLRCYHLISNPENKDQCSVDWSGLLLKEIPIHNANFMDISKRSTLFLSNNMLTKLPALYEYEENFMWLDHLQRLILSNNKIEQVNKKLFDIPSLQELTFTHNLVKELPDDIKFSENFHSLYLGYNHLRALPNSLTESCICILDIGYNKFEILPDCVCEMKKLCNLTLDGNKGILEFPLKLGQFCLETIVSCKDMDQVLLLIFSSTLLWDLKVLRYSL